MPLLSLAIAERGAVGPPAVVSVGCNRVAGRGSRQHVCDEALVPAGDGMLQGLAMPGARPRTMPGPLDGVNGFYAQIGHQSASKPQSRKARRQGVIREDTSAILTQAIGQRGNNE